MSGYSEVVVPADIKPSQIRYYERQIPIQVEVRKSNDKWILSVVTDLSSIYPEFNGMTIISSSPHVYNYYPFVGYFNLKEGIIPSLLCLEK